MDKYPSLVYRCPGPHQRPGGTFDYKGVASKDEESAALSDGWFLTVPEAIAEKPVAPAIDPVPVVEPEIEPLPTRAEMEQQAKELGLKFGNGTPDAALLKAIDDALKA